MPFDIDERESDAPFVQTIWRTRSDRLGAFTSVAVSRWELVVTRLRGEWTVSVRGPETTATRAPVPADAEFFGIAFEHGAFMPQLPSAALVNGGLDLPRAGARSFRLNGRIWQVPSFGNADTFVRRLIRNGALVLDGAVADTLRGRRVPLSTRTLRRRCLRATGLTPALIRQIDRARHATARLQRGVSILDVVSAAGYFDQPHLTRSLKRFVGHTPAEILPEDRGPVMSLSYKTREFREGNLRASTTTDE